MMRHGPAEARLLGLWTAGCLFVLLLAGILWVGDLALQWPVLAVPVLWALVAARPRRGAVRPLPPPDPRAQPAWPDRPGGDDGHPTTREAPTLPRVPRERGPRDW
ncbi:MULTISPECIES: hypothetical protein [unclassified Blastococcus]